MYILIVILVLFIGSLVAAYFAARTWHWGHVVLVVSIFLATVGFMILAAETLRINALLRAKANKIERELNQVTARNNALQHGTRDEQLINELSAQEVQVREGASEMPGIPDLDHKLNLETRVRGRVWRNVAPAGFNPQTTVLQVTIESPQPPGIEKESILYVFDQGEPALPDPTRGPQYLGEFRVKEAAGQQVAMVSVHLLDDFERQRLANSRGPWALYETMPIDRYDLFKGLSEEELRKWLPEKSVNEYIRQGTTAGPDDDEWHRGGVDDNGNALYQRRLRDYTVEFDELARHRVVLLADIAGVLKDNERLKAALESAKKLQAFREEELRKLGIDLAGITKEREIIEKHLAVVQEQLKNARDLLAQALAENKRLAQQLAALQAQWKDLMDQRSSGVPSEGPLAISK